jgi:hypothetical protein
MSLVVGGVVPPENVVGRVREQQEALGTMSRGGCVLVGDRRHGKTSLARLVLHSATAAGAKAVVVSAERQSYEEFVGALAGQLSKVDNVLRQEIENWRMSFGAGPLRLQREQVAPALDDLLQRALARCEGRLLVLFIDEVTILARNLERERTGAGDSFLHLLRRFRQENAGRVATLLSGSIGFHHVSRDSLSTVNDIPKIAIGPIRTDHAAYLAECLMMGANVAATNSAAVSSAIAAAAENVPYYIQHLVAAAARTAPRERPIGPEIIEDLKRAALEDPYDRWDLRHYRNRLSDYYGDDANSIAKLLDIYAHADRPLATDSVLQRLQNEGSRITDHAQLVSFVERLEQDHYLRRVGAEDCFASDLLKTAWKAMRR